MSIIRLFSKCDKNYITFKNLKVIPDKIWSAYFNDALLDIEESLLKITPREALNILRRQEILELSESRKKCCWLILLCKRASLNILLEALTILHINIERWIEERDGLLLKLSATIQGRPVALESLSIIFFRSLSLRSSINSNLSVNSIFQSMFKSSCISIGGNFRRRVFPYFETADNFQRYSLSSTHKKIYELCFLEAVASGNLETVDYLLNNFKTEAKNFIKAKSYKAFRIGVRNGYLPVIERIIRYMPDKVLSMLSLLSYGDLTFAYLKGNSEVLDYLFDLEPFILVSGKLKVFQKAAANGHLEIMNHLVELSPYLVEDMISQDNFAVFIEAAANGHMKILNRLVELSPDFIDYMIAANNYHAFHQAAANGHVLILERLLELAQNLRQEMIDTVIFSAFRSAAANGHIQVLYWLSNLSLIILEDLIVSYKFGAFRNAAANGQSESLDWLINKSPSHVQQMIKSDNFNAFRAAAQNGQLETLEKLIKLAPNKLQAMIAADNFFAFSFAAGNGHLNVLDRLIELAPHRVKDMIKASNYSSFRYAAANGYILILKRIMQLYPNRIQVMIAAENFFAFREAAANGHFIILDFLIGLSPNCMQNMIMAENFYAFRKAAANGHLKVLEGIINLSPNLAQAMIASDNFGAFIAAAAGGHLEVLEFLIDLSPNLVEDMVLADNFNAFRLAALRGNIAVLELLIDLSQNYAQDMIAAHNFFIFKHVIKYSESFARKLLNISNGLFAYVETHDREYSYIIDVYVEEILIRLHQEHDLFVYYNPNMVFDILDMHEAKRCFYIIRHLIRFNNFEFLDEIRFLIGIPSVKALLHREVTPNQPNELLRFALTINNRDAVILLLNIPAVRELTENNNYYCHESQGVFNLRELAQDPESSMTALNPGEQKSLQLVIDYYLPQVSSAGIDNIMNDLMVTLRSFYENHPATIIQDNGYPLTLPIGIKEYQSLFLTFNEQTKACKAYYKNIYHTAYRYLSKPNYWMSEKALYVNISEDGTEKWSTFEEYKTIICMFYLAAKDNNYPAIDGQTLETRVENFIRELALIGRAHNWDKSRICSSGLEEYDDLEGDKPSCFSGVKRRLFQSVLGHSLFKFLRFDDIKEELRSFMREHFADNITNDNLDILQKSWMKLCATGETDAVFSELNVSLEKQKQFIESLEYKYKDKFSGEPIFIKYIEDSFLVTERFPCHLVRFAGLVNFEHLLEAKMHILSLRNFS